MKKKNDQKTKYVVLSTWGSMLLVFALVLFKEQTFYKITLILLSIILSSTAIIGQARIEKKTQKLQINNLMEKRGI